MNGGDNSERSDKVISLEVEQKLFRNEREIRMDYVRKCQILSGNPTEC